MQEQYTNCTIPLDITFKEYSAIWLDTFKSAREAATVAMYDNVKGKFEVIESYPIKNIKPIDLQGIVNNNADHPRLCQIIRLYANQVFESAIRDKVITDNPMKSVTIPKYVPDERRALTEEEKKALTRCKLKSMDEIYIYTLYYCGLRPAEALALMPTDFDFKKKSVTISRSIGFDGNAPYIKKTKTQKVRTVPIPDAFVPMLTNYLKSNKALYLINKNGKIINKTAKSNMWKRIKKQINIELGGNSKFDLTDGLIPYTFRHNYCCTCYYAGLTPLMTAKLMGNSAQVVMKVYTHLDESKENLDALRSLCI